MKNTLKVRIIYSSDISIGYVKKLELVAGDIVVAETEHGAELAKVLTAPEPAPDQNVAKKAIKIVRLATKQDMRKNEINLRLNDEAFDICHEKIHKYKLPMKLVAVHHFLEGNKILFYFTSEGRIDFRALVKELAGIFKTRIELRQIGVRDEARITGGYGVCGLQLCCHVCKRMTQPVSIKMAKEQNLSLNSSKISGSCGRLLCCLGYEQLTYKKLNKKFPRPGAKVWFGEEKTAVKDVNVLTGMVQLITDDQKLLEYPCDAIKTNKLTGKKFVEEKK